ncbi:uncharacterized protein LOC132744412 [Ruditapes philippinarum]|uniref:uncharacterized protein LOC132744412 n=1 Tax=Ruditapes philippinarum TaxID=129788 RepID=UPI00295B70E8|nr:uncharacterized protein LOC132744412 [Ruditapes philippinarum]
MIFSPQPAQTQVIQQEPPRMTVTQATQTEPEAAPTPRVDSLAPLNAVLGHFEKTMEVAMGKMIFAVESVARATRHVQQSIDALGTTVSQVTRAVDRLTDEQRRLARSRESTGNQSNKRAREDEDKENDRALKSVQMNIRFVLLVTSSLSHLMGTGADVFILQTARQTVSECGRNLTLACKFKPDTFCIVWKNANDMATIAECKQKWCKLNPIYAGKYRISFDLNQCILNLTMIKATIEDNGRKLVCSDGSHIASKIVNIRDREPLLYEDTKSGTIMAKSGCTSQNTNVSFKWKLISVNSDNEKEIDPKIRERKTLSCKNDSDCGNDKQVHYTEIIAVNASVNGNYHLKVAAIYGNESKETHYSYKSIMKVRDEEQDDLPILSADEEHLNPGSASIKTKYYVGGFLLAAATILCILPIYR